MSDLLLLTPSQLAGSGRISRSSTVSHILMICKTVCAPLDWLHFEVCCVCEKVSCFIVSG